MLEEGIAGVCEGAGAPWWWQGGTGNVGREALAPQGAGLAQALARLTRLRWLAGGSKGCWEPVREALGSMISRAAGPGASKEVGCMGCQDGRRHRAPLGVETTGGSHRLGRPNVDPKIYQEALKKVNEKDNMPTSLKSDYPSPKYGEYIPSSKARDLMPSYQEKENLSSLQDEEDRPFPKHEMYDSSPNRVHTCHETSNYLEEGERRPSSEILHDYRVLDVFVYVLSSPSKFKENNSKGEVDPSTREKKIENSDGGVEVYMHVDDQNSTEVPIHEDEIKNVFSVSAYAEVAGSSDRTLAMDHEMATSKQKEAVLKILEDVCYASTTYKDGRDVPSGDRLPQGAVHILEEVRTKAICLVASKLYPLSYISQNIEDFSTKMLLSVVDGLKIMNGMDIDESSIVGNKDGNQQNLPNGRMKKSKWPKRKAQVIWDEKKLGKIVANKPPK
eukprot:Gb_30957 [translate_table: standard]